MKRWGGVWLIFLIVGMSLSTAFSSTPVAAATSDLYQEFWDILNREAELVVEVENGNLTLASELIQNSRLGAENAVNISALIWQALEELKESGVKTYYTAEELREMAQNISRNGLPQETVQALKSQGWSDNEIRALEEYIAQNAGSINEDFNMTAFLEDFSRSFLNISSKYSEYVVLPLRKKLETQYGGLISTEGVILESEVEGNGMIVPLSGLDEYRNEVSALRQVLSSSSSEEVKVNALDNFQLRVLSLIQREPKVIKREKHIVPSKSNSPPCVPEDHIILTIRRAISDKKLRTPNTELLSNYTKNNLSNESIGIGGVSFVVVDKGVTVIHGNYFVYLRTAVISIRFFNEDCSIHVDEDVTLKLYQWDAFRILTESETLKYLIMAKSLGNKDPWVDDRINGILEWLSDDALKVKNVKTLTWSKSFRIPLYSPPVPPKDGVDEKGSPGEDTVYQGSDDNSCLSGVPLEGRLEVYPEWIEAGDSVSVHVTVTNLDPNCAQGPFNIELVDDSGAKWWPKKDMNYGCSGCGYVIQDGALKIYAGRTMSEWTNFNNIGQTTTLYLKVGGKTLASAKINVKQDGPVKASMECIDSAIPYDGSTTCKIYLLNTVGKEIHLRVESVDFGTLTNVWALSYQRGITIDPITVTLPSNDDKVVIVDIDLRKLASDLWGNDHFAYKFAEHESYLVTVHFDSGTVISDVLTIKDASEDQEDPGIVKVAGVASGILGGLLSGLSTKNPKATVEGAVVGYIIGVATTKAIISFSWEVYAFLKGVQGIPEDSNGNAIIGG